VWNPRSRGCGLGFCMFGGMTYHQADVP
jgi:hypothetical protein